MENNLNNLNKWYTENNVSCLRFLGKWIAKKGTFKAIGKTEIEAVNNLCDKINNFVKSNSPSPVIETIKVFSPVNDAEAQTFINTWCENCKNVRRDKIRNLVISSCSILHRAHLFDQTAKEYPIEWQRDDKNRPLCKGFK